MNCNEYKLFTKHMRHFIKQEYTKKRNGVPSKDILDTEEDVILSTFALKITQSYMIRGKIWQEALGSFKNCINLDNDINLRNKFGVDILDRKNKFVIEVKNKFNTTNSKGLKALRDKLSIIKMKYPKFDVIHGIINGKNLKSYRKTIIHEYNGNIIEIEELVGMELFKFVFGSDCEKICKFIKKEVVKHEDTRKILNYIKENIL